MRKPIYNDALLKDIVDLYIKENMPMKDVADALGLKARQVQYVLKKNNIHKDGRGIKRPVETKNEEFEKLDDNHYIKNDRIYKRIRSKEEFINCINKLINKQ